VTTRLEHPPASEGEQLFITQLAEIDRVIAFVCARHFVQPADAEDFAAQVKVKLIQDDYAVLRKFQQRSSFRTYLTIVVRRAFIDYCVSTWGKWRPSAEAKRCGPVATLLEQLTARDGHTLDEAFEILTTNHRVAIGRGEFEALAGRLPERAPRRFESDERLRDLPSPAPTPDEAAVECERRAAARRALQALHDSLKGFTDQDRLVLRMRFEDGRTVADIASALHLDQKTLYRRFDRLLRQLRTGLESAGIGESAWRDILACESGPERPSMKDGMR
jgi:RNA polymerase sigma factor for flagellar operon FliA